MKIEIKHRFTGEIQFTANVDGRVFRDAAKRLGEALKQAFRAGADLRGAYLRGAYLRAADLRGAYLEGADLRGAYLEGADLRGADLEGADLRGAYLEGADLRGAYLEGADLRGADLEGAYLRAADLRGAYLEGAYLRAADLRGAYLRAAYLRGAYLRAADLEIPIIKNIHQKVYEAASQPKALQMDSWHTCETTHCRAGWVTTLAGEAGKKLEDEVGTASAAYLIYRKSDPDTPFALDFYDTNDGALAEMKRMAELEASK